MSRTTVFAGVAIILIAAASTYHYATTPSPIPQPELEYPPRIDLGTIRPGKLEVTIRLANQGSMELKIHDFKTGCSCLSLTNSHGNPIKPGDSLIVPADEATSLIAEINIPRATRNGFLTTLRFSTNAPNQSSVEIPIIGQLVGNIVAFPAEVVFTRNSFKDGEFKQNVFVLATGQTNEARIRAVEASTSSTIKVEFVQTSGVQIPAAVPRLGTPVAQFQVTIQNPGFGRHDPGEVLVYQEGIAAPVLRVPVSGRIDAPFQLLPATVVLPRRSDSGLIRESKVFCRDSQGIPFRLEVSDSDHIEIVGHVRERLSSSHVITVRLKPSDTMQLGDPHDEIIPIRAIYDDHQYSQHLEATIVPIDIETEISQP